MTDEHIDAPAWLDDQVAAVFARGGHVVVNYPDVDIWPCLFRRLADLGPEAALFAPDVGYPAGGSTGWLSFPDWFAHGDTRPALTATRTRRNGKGALEWLEAMARRAEAPLPLRPVDLVVSAVSHRPLLIVTEVLEWNADPPSWRRAYLAAFRQGRVVVADPELRSASTGHPGWVLADGTSLGDSLSGTR